VDVLLMKVAVDQDAWLRCCDLCMSSALGPGARTGDGGALTESSRTGLGRWTVCFPAGDRERTLNDSPLRTSDPAACATPLYRADWQEERTEPRCRRIHPQQDRHDHATA